MLNETIVVYLQDIRKEIMTVSLSQCDENLSSQWWFSNIGIIANFVFPHRAICTCLFYLDHVILINVKSDVINE